MLTLVTDFGATDEYSGVVKGAALRINPDLTIVDISHAVEPQNISQGARMIFAAYRYFPEKTIHTCIVDPGVGGNRRIVALETRHYRFLAPDNGILTHILDAESVANVVSVENPDYFHDTVSATFHGRDIFAPVAGHLSRGTPLENLGPVVPASGMVRLKEPMPKQAADETLTGEVTGCDHFGNLITNIDFQAVQELTGGQPRRLSVTVGGKSIRGLADNYESGAGGEAMAIIGSRGFLEIAVYAKSAAATLRVGSQDVVVLRRIDN